MLRAFLITLLFLSTQTASSFTRINSNTFSRITLGARPRRLLKKKQRNNRDRQSSSSVTTTTSVEGGDDFPWDTAESRPLIKTRSIQAGEDYWMDEEDLRRSLQREEAIRNRKKLEGEISEEKLKGEVVAPYKQNWIGFISAFFVVIAFIVQYFPDLMQIPVIKIPDI